MKPRVPIIRLPHGEGLPLPAYETAHAAGMDLRAAVPEDEPLTLHPGDRRPVPTGLAIASPVGTACRSPGCSTSGSPSGTAARRSMPAACAVS